MTFKHLTDGVSQMIAIEPVIMIHTINIYNKEMNALTVYLHIFLIITRYLLLYILMYLFILIFPLFLQFPSNL